MEQVAFVAARRFWVRVDRGGAAGPGAELQTASILALAVLFAYLFLVALYESTAIPVAALLSVVVGLFGAVLALYVIGLTTISSRRSASSC